MKQLILALIMGMTLCTAQQAIASEKTDAHIAYVYKNLKLDAASKAKLKPLLEKYYAERAEVKQAHKALKDKLQAVEDKGKLTDAQCDQLFSSKQAQETAELALKKKYYALFKTVLKTQQAYQAIKLCDDKVK